MAILALLQGREVEPPPPCVCVCVCVWVCVQCVFARARASGLVARRRFPAPGAVAEPRTGGRWESVRWNRGLSPPAAFVAPDYNRRNRYNRFNVIGGGVIPAELAQRL